MQNISVALTSCGGKVIPGIVECLRAESEYDFHVVGVDMDERAVGKYFVDAFYSVPHGLSEKYIDCMLDVTRREDVDVIVPLSDEEARSLSKAQERFVEEGVSIVCSDHETVSMASNKGTLLSALEREGVEVPDFDEVSTLSELDRTIEALGYPDRDLVLKPAQARGGRGFWRLTNDRNERELTLGERCLQTISYETLRSMLDGEESLPPLVVMEYLGGTDYNVDVLADDGEAVYTMPIERIEPDAGPVEVGHIVHNEQIDVMADQITSALEFNYNINIELAYRTPDDQGNPLVYEINPRVSGPIAMHAEAGVNLLLYGILMSLGKSVPRNEEYVDTLSHRCWREVYPK